LLGAYLRANKLGDNFSLIEFKHDYNCSWELVVHILTDFGINITGEQVRNTLVKQYIKFVSAHKMDEIITIWIKEGKGFLVDAFKNNISTTITLINYYLTPFDLFILFTYFNCPCILTSRSKISLGTRKNISFVQMPNPQYVYVILGGAWSVTGRNEREKVPIYGILQNMDAIKLSPAYFGDFYSTLVANPLTNIDAYYKYSTMVKIKLKTITIKKNN
jgi:hypothetical protein